MKEIKRYTNVELKQFKELLKQGFSKDDLEIEFGIERDILDKLENMEFSERPITRMENLRKNYRLAMEENSSNNATPSVWGTTIITPANRAVVEAAIEKSKSIIEEAKGDKVDRKRLAAELVIEEIKKIADLPIDEVLAAEIYKIFSNREFQNIRNAKKDKLPLKISTMQNRYAQIFLETMNNKFSYTMENGSIEELKALQDFYRKHSSIGYASGTQIQLYSLYTKVRDKSDSISKFISLKNLIEDISPEIDFITSQVALGTLNIAEGKKALDNDIKNRMAKPRAYKLQKTEDHYKNQAFIQIRHLLVNKSDKYHMVDPIKAYELLNSLAGSQEEFSIVQANSNAAVNALIAEDRLIEAENFCNSLTSEKESEFRKYIDRTLKKVVARAKVASLVRRAIKANPYDEEDEFLKSIEEGLEKSKMSKSSIELGINQSTGKKVTLENIWPSVVRYR